MRQRYSLTKRCIEHSFVFVRIDLNIHRLKANSVCRHPPPLSSSRQPSRVPCWTACRTLIAPGNKVQERLSPLRKSYLTRLFNGETLAILGHMSFPLLGCHLVEQHIRALELNAFEMVQRPHVLVIEDNMRLRNERLAIRANEALILQN